MIRGWVEADIPHGSAVMLPDGQMFGRVLRADRRFEPIDCINVAGDDLHFWYADAGSVELPSFVASHAQAFDEGTIERLRRLSIAVIGARAPAARRSSSSCGLAPASSSLSMTIIWKTATSTAS